jgi:tetratricopeptide (TPR) repeat protein
LLEEWLQEDPDDASAARELSLIYRWQGRYEKAFSLARKAARLDPDNAQAWVAYGIAGVQMCTGGRTPTRHSCQGILAEVEEAAEHLADLCRQRESEIGQEECLSRAFLVSDWLWCASFFREAGRLDSACEAYAKAILLAKELANSEDPKCRSWGQAQLRSCMEEDFAGLQSLCGGRETRDRRNHWGTPKSP